MENDTRLMFTDFNQRLIEGLARFLDMKQREARQLVALLNEQERLAMHEHLEHSKTPIVGLASVVYRARMRIAGGDCDLQAKAASEADRKICRDTFTGDTCKAAARAAENGAGSLPAATTGT